MAPWRRVDGSPRGAADAGSAAAPQSVVADQANMALGPDERPGTLPKLSVTWSGVILTPNAVISGIIATAAMNGAGFPLGLLGLVIGIVLGSGAVAWLSTWGPRTGLAQMALGRLAFGRGNRVPEAVLIVSLIIYSTLGLLFGVSALTTALHVPFPVGLAFTGGLQLVIGVIGIKLFERIGGVVTGLMVVVMVALAFGAAHTMRMTLPDPGSMRLAGIAVGVALGMGESFSWAVQATDTSRTLRATTRPVPLFLTVWSSMVVPLVLLGAVGSWIATAMSVDEPMARVSEVLGGGFIAAVALVAMAMALAAQNAYNDLSSVIVLRSFGARLSRRVLSACVSLTAIALALILRATPLGDLAENAVIVTGYFVGPWFGVLAVELIRRRRQRDPVAVPARNGWAGAVAFVFGFVGLFAFSSTTVGDQLAMDFHALDWVGLVPRLYLDHADLGYFAGIVLGAAMYALLLWVAGRRRARSRASA